MAQTDHPEYDVYELIFRDMVNYRPVDRAKPCELFFLSIEQERPPEDLLARFQNASVAVKPISDAKIAVGKRVVDRATGKAGICLNVTKIIWGEDRHTASVVADYVGRPESENLGFEYHVELKDGHWTVASSGLLYAD